MTDTNQIKRALRRDKPKSRCGPFLSTGSTLVNLACTGRVDGGFLAGKYYFMVGDSNSGKTFLGLTCLAEAAIDPAFDGYRLIYDGVEGGALMNFKRFFGPRMAKRVEPPARDKADNPVFSWPVEQFYDHLDDAVKDGRPFVYVLDSQDALTSESELKKAAQLKRGRRKEKGEDDKTTGSYGDNKAKVHSANIRRFLTPLEKSGSILLMLNQTRDSFNMFEESTYSGGRALLFYSTLQLWSSVKTQIKKTVKGKPRQLGIVAKVRVKKNRVTGRDRTVLVPIFHSHGIDDVGGCVDYLVEEGYWKGKGRGVITATGLGPTMEARREKLVKLIEEGEMEDDLRELVGQVWGDIEAACKIERKSRYS